MTDNEKSDLFNNLKTMLIVIYVITILMYLYLIEKWDDVFMRFEGTVPLKFVVFLFLTSLTIDFAVIVIIIYEYKYAMIGISIYHILFDNVQFFRRCHGVCLRITLCVVGRHYCLCYVIMIDKYETRDVINMSQHLT